MDNTPEPPGARRSLHLLQFTDLHFPHSAGHRIWDLDTPALFELALRDAGRRYPDAALAVFTGDMVHVPGHTAYELVAAALADAPWPLCALPGNHDDRCLMQESLASGRLSLAPRRSLGPWEIVLLDSNAPGGTARLSPHELHRLDMSLRRAGSRPALICLHHHPVEIGSPWMDAMMLENADALFGITDRHPTVKGMIWGHIHQEFETCRGDMSLWGTPSTCLQFRPGSETFTPDTLGPAYRRITLHADGTLESAVHYVDPS